METPDPKGEVPCTLGNNAGNPPSDKSKATLSISFDDFVDPIAQLVGTRIGNYEIIQIIAQGGMGAVYKARQIHLNRVVALKVILSGQFARETEVKRFFTEAEAVAHLDHPNIVSIFEVGIFEGRHFFTMQYIEGGSMAHHLPSLRENLEKGIALMVKVTRAIHFAHQRGILHRDLKPANIFLDVPGEPHVTDFGLARGNRQPEPRFFSFEPEWLSLRYRVFPLKPFEAGEVGVRGLE